MPTLSVCLTAMNPKASVSAPGCLTLSEHRSILNIVNLEGTLDQIEANDRTPKMTIQRSILPRTEAADTNASQISGRETKLH